MDMSSMELIPEYCRFVSDSYIKIKLISVLAQMRCTAVRLLLCILRQNTEMGRGMVTTSYMYYPLLIFHFTTCTNSGVLLSTVFGRIGSVMTELWHWVML